MIIKSSLIAYVECIGLSADQWQLYHIDGRDEAAERLNVAMFEAINGNTRLIAYRLGLKALNTESEFGACDTEGVDTLQFIIRKIFGE